MHTLRNHLGPISHIVAGLIPLAWRTALRPEPRPELVEGFTEGLTHAWPHPGLVFLCAFLALAADLDTGSSHLGRLFPWLSRPIERRFGHRTVTHSSLAVVFVAAVTRVSFPDGWTWLVAAFVSHIVVDMIVGGEVGVPLLWPGPWRFYLAQIQPASTGEATITGLLLATCLLPLAWPQAASTTAAILPQPEEIVVFTPTPTVTPTPTPTPHLITVRIFHVYDPSAEILVKPGDVITAGHLLADLATYRRLIAPTATPTDQPTNTPTATPTPRPTPTGRPIELQATAIAADLAQAEARYRRAVAPPTPDPARIATLRAQATAVAGGVQDRQSALDRCQREGTCDDWRYQAQAVELATLQAQAPVIATALHEARFPPDPDPLAIAIAQADYEAAQAGYELKLAALPLHPEQLEPTEELIEDPTSTTTPTPHPIYQSTNLPTPTPSHSPFDDSLIRSLVAGRVVAVEISNVTGNEATIEIVIEVK